MKKLQIFLIAEKGYSKAIRKYSKNFRPDKRKMFMLYFSSLISSDNISSADECREKLNQLDMLEAFLKEKSDEEYLKRISDAKRIVEADLKGF